MEKILGKKLYELDELDESFPVDRKFISDNGVKLFMKQVLEDGFFHADLHAGNVFFLEDNRLAIIDCGMTGVLDSYTREQVAEMFIAFARRDYMTLVNIYIEMSDTPETLDKKHLVKDIRRVIESLPEKLAEVNTTKLFRDLSVIMYRHKLKIPRNLTLLLRGVSMFEGMGRQLAPDFDFLGQTQTLASYLIKAKYTPDKIADSLFFVLMRAVDMAKTLPLNISELIDRIERGNLQHKVIFLLGKSDKKFFSRLVTRISTAFILTGAMVSFKSFDNAPLSIFIYSVFVISLVLFLSSFRKDDDKKN